MKSVSLCRHLAVIALLSLGGLSITSADVWAPPAQPVPARQFADPRAAVMVEAIQKGNMSKFEAGLDEGIKPNAQGLGGYRPIHFAFAPTSSVDVLSKLLDAGADPNFAIATGDRPIHFAARNPDPRFIRTLIDTGLVNVNARGDSNEPVIHVVLPFHSVKVLEALAGAKADMNIEWNGMSPLYSAVVNTNWTMAAALARLGSENDFKDNLGRSATDALCYMITRAKPDAVNQPGISALIGAFERREFRMPCAPAIAAWR